jgi:hypothetical protein
LLNRRRNSSFGAWGIELSDNNLFVLCGFVGGWVVNYVVHELGHLLGAGITGLRVRGLILFELRFGTGLKGLQRFSHLKNAVVVNHGSRLRRLRFGVFTLSGPAANLAVGLVAADMVSAQSSALIKDVLAGLALAAVPFGLVNLVPLTTRKGGVSDGRKIYELMRYGTVAGDNPLSRLPHSFPGYSTRRPRKAESSRSVAGRKYTRADDALRIDAAADVLVEVVHDPVTLAATAVRAALILRYSIAASALAVDAAELRTKLFQRADAARLIAHGSPLCQVVGRFRAMRVRRVLAALKQTALDRGCGPALIEGVGNGAKNGSVR